MGHGGKREGAGRKRSRATTKTRAVADRIAASGLTPLQYMMRVLRNPNASLERRDWAAEKAAPYIHPRLQAIEHKGDPAKPIGFAVYDMREVARRALYVLAVEEAEQEKERALLPAPKVSTG